MSDNPVMIGFLDRIAALQRMPPEDRIRAGTEELRGIYDLLPVWLGVAAHAGMHPNDDGLPWGHCPGGGEWVELDKAPLVKAGHGPAPFYVTLDNAFTHVVHKP